MMTHGGRTPCASFLTLLDEVTERIGSLRRMRMAIDICQGSLCDKGERHVATIYCHHCYCCRARYLVQSNQCLGPRRPPGLVRPWASARGRIPSRVQSWVPRSLRRPIPWRVRISRWVPSWILRPLLRGRTRRRMLQRLERMSRLIRMRWLGLPPCPWLSLWVRFWPALRLLTSLFRFQAGAPLRRTDGTVAKGRRKLPLFCFAFD